MARRILSITAAPGWSARFRSSDDDDGERVVTLAVWALVETEGGDPEIVGLVQRSTAVGALGFADEVDGFDGYSFQGLGTKPVDY